jgi:hypothetical protein
VSLNYEEYVQGKVCPFLGHKGIEEDDLTVAVFQTDKL